MPDYDTANTTSTMLPNPPSVGLFVEKVKRQTEKTTELGRVKVPAANWLFTIKPRLERQEINLGMMAFRAHRHPRYLAGHLTAWRPFWPPTASFIARRPLDFISAIIPNRV